MRKRVRVANVLRAMAKACEGAAAAFEDIHKPMSSEVGRMLFLTCVLNGYLPYLCRQYREWGKARSKTHLQK